mgnify:FL=1
MEKKKIGKGLIAGGIAGSILCVVAEWFLYINRLREVETASFSVVGSNEIRTISVGIQNWLLLSIIVLLLLALCLFLLGIGFKLCNKNH